MVLSDTNWIHSVKKGKKVNKTTVLNLLAIAGTIVNSLTGSVIPDEYAALGIAIINAIAAIWRKE